MKIAHIGEIKQKYKMIQLMYNNEKNFTRLTVEQNDRKVVWEVPYDDVSGEDMMQAIRTIMIGMTFNDKSIESSMANYLQEHSDDYDIIEKEDTKFGYDFETQGLTGGFLHSPDEYKTNE